MYQKQPVWKQYYRQIEQKPFITAALIGINIIVYIICAFTGDLLYNGGGVGLRVVLETGEIYRIITSMFLHADIPHIFSNMLLLIALGDMLESKVGHWKFLVIYLLSGIGGNLSSMFIELRTGENLYSVGASGAVYGVCGIMLGAAVLRDCKDLYIDPVRVVLILGYSIYNGFRSPGINNIAHIGGLVFGFVLYLIFYFLERMFLSKDKKRRYT